MDLRSMTMGTTNSESMFDRLPEDVVRAILRELPVKTLGCCITLSKSFASIISSSSFIYSLPCSASPANDGSVVFVKCNTKYPQANCTVISGSSGCKDCSCPNSAFGLNVAGRNKLKVAGACKGLICLREVPGNRLLLCNPLIKRSFILPETGIDLPSSPHLTRIGLGFDSTDNDYKILMVPYSTMPRSGGKAYRGGRDMYLYSLKSDSWKAVGSSLESLPTTDKVMTAPLVFAGGSLHYLEGSEFSSTIVAFDMGGRALRRISTPADAQYAVRRLSICEYDGGSSIALIATTGETRGRDLYNLWVMKEYGVADSWVKLTLEDSVCLTRIPWFRQSDCICIKLPISQKYTELYRWMRSCEHEGSIYFRDEGCNCRIPMTEPLMCSFDWKKRENDGYRYAASTVDSLALLDKRSIITDLP